MLSTGSPHVAPIQAAAHLFSFHNDNHLLRAPDGARQGTSAHDPSTVLQSEGREVQERLGTCARSQSWAAAHPGLRQAFPALSAARMLLSQPSGSGLGMVPKSSRSSPIAITGHERPFVILCVYTAASLLAPGCWKLHA